MSEATQKPNDPLRLDVRVKQGQTEDQAVAAMALDPATLNALTAVTYNKRSFGEVSLQECAAAMREDIKRVNDGDLDKLEGMLMAQATALNAMFNNFAIKAADAQMMPHLESYCRLALKAQSQCRSTIEALAEIKYPKSATFIKQANIAGQQQVNNGQASSRSSTPVRAQEKNIIPSNELLGVTHGERLDIGAQAAPGGFNPELETVGAVDRAH